MQFKMVLGALLLTVTAVFGHATPLLVAGLSPVQQNESAVSISVSSDKTEATVGDVVAITVAVTHPAGSRILWPQISESWGDFEVKEQNPAETMPAADGLLTTQTLLVTLWVPGEYATPPLLLTVAESGGQLVEIVTPSADLKIVSVLETDDLSLRDLKPQAVLGMPFPWSQLLIGLGVALLLAATAYWLWQRRSRQPATAVSFPLPDNRPAYQIALDELARIEGLDLPGQASFKEHYTLVTDALRRYLEAAFSVPARDRTTAEMGPALAETALPAEQQQALVTLLADADLVKFAELRPDPGLARLLPQEAKRLVLETASVGNDSLETL